MTRTFSSLQWYSVAVKVCVALTLISIISYVSLTLFTVFSTANRTALVREAQLYTSNISSLESAYFALDASVTSDEAGLRGFVTPKKVAFVTKPSSAQTLSLRVE